MEEAHFLVSICLIVVQGIPSHEVVRRTPNDSRLSVIDADNSTQYLGMGHCILRLLDSQQDSLAEW